jgi:hypothetical protein
MAQAATNGGYSLDASNKAQVLMLYRTVYASSTQVPSGWSGNVANCVAGDTTAEFKAATLRRINWFRAMAGVPADVQFDPVFNAKAQQAAVMMSAAVALDHHPGPGWPCYTADGAEAASHSDLALGRSGADSIGDSYMRDNGSNNSAAGHRRWILYPQTQFMGTGDIDSTVPSNVLWVQDANIAGRRPAVRDDFVAWPPPGYVPYQTVYPRWSISYPGADFSAAAVTMTSAGASVATRTELLQNGYGENTLVWFPGSYADGNLWAKPAADTAYHVTVSNVNIGGAPRTFEYDVVVFDPDAAAIDPVTIAGPAVLANAQQGTYTFNAVTGATAYEWRTLALSPYALQDGAENGTGNFDVSVTPGYGFIATDVSASGAASFHFAQPQQADQTLTLKQPLAIDASSTVSFASRVGVASTNQRGLVEVSTDDGANWAVVFAQAGTQTGVSANWGELSFTTKSISLAAYAGRTVRLRWRYAVEPGTLWYPQSSAGVGWYVDDIRLSGVRAVTAGAASAAAGTSFQVTGSGAAFALQARSGLYGYFTDWGPILNVSATAAATGAECLFNWAEQNYAGLFAPASTTQSLAPYTFRFYSATGVYLGISSADNHVYYMLGGALHDVGDKAQWFATAGCSP